VTFPLRVDGQASFSVQQGQTLTAGTISGHGSQIRVHAESPEALLASVLDGPGSSALPALAKQLREHDLQVLVTGPRGPLATVGAGVDNNLAGRLLLGSRHVRPGGPRALAPLARTAAPLAVRAVAGASGAVLFLVFVLSYALHRRRRGETSR
jgi:hypothetical protein